ncbi:MAG: PIN domain nuclease, partial [Desulfobacca sp.]|nr:PIN domain nuclease [Desulfobacca sp.]
SIAGTLRIASSLPWIPYAGGLLGLVGALLILAVEKQIKKAPLGSSLGGATGLVLGLVIGRLLMFPFECFRNEVFLHYFILLSMSGISGYLGLALGSSKAGEIGKLTASALTTPVLSKNFFRYLLDTSVIIDGRIADICETGFLQGTLIIPQFILQELHHIADSNDSLKKIRGRRGLDVIEKIQKQKDLEVLILDQNPPKDNVDAKLVDLALELQGTIITNDFNLNKVAELRGVKCLNLNKLANALKPAVLPGEVINAQIIREGKTTGQGIAYMDDGTMVVVENARRHIGRTIEVIVTSVLQTGTGRMIFTEIKNG